ncbi:MAG: aldose 1-epimerase family protein [Clostridia bacterium]|nr:aldose 1-epimerase family protein [Clostridia bacterium]
MITLSYNDTKAEISNIGAQLRSLKLKNIEYIWQPDKNIWNESAPVLFPICSGLKDDEYIYNGRTYHMQKHGFASSEVFTVENKTDNSVTLLHMSNESIKAQYPFDYELRVIFTLSEAKLDVKYEVKNLSAETMYFSIGAHEGYRLPYGLENYEIKFSQRETLYAYKVCGGVLSGEKKLILKDNNILPLKYDYFTDDALIFKDLKSKSAVLKTNMSRRSIKVMFEGFDYFLVWTVPKADFVCIEPWCGITDNADHDKDITKKEGINALSPQKTFFRSHSIEII